MIETCPVFLLLKVGDAQPVQCSAPHTAMARGASGMTALQLQGDGAAVEHERLATLADTQRRHIEELQAQLHEALAAKEALQLAAVERSPAPKSARALLSRAAADNTALARKVEALRAQRNALAVTKAALTMQLSELIRTAADDAQRAAQHEIHLARVRVLHCVCVCVCVRARVRACACLEACLDACCTASEDKCSAAHAPPLRGVRGAQPPCQ